MMIESIMESCIHIEGLIKTLRAIKIDVIQSSLNGGSPLLHFLSATVRTLGGRARTSWKNVVALQEGF